jgi:glycosyltransferase involved in cell wall biosynthesis
MTMNAKKIAIVSDAVYPFNKGGKEMRIHDITTRLAAQGYDVTIYCMQWWKGEKVIMQNGVRLSAVSPYYPLYVGHRRSIKEAIFFALHCLKLFNEQFDVIEVDHMPHLVLFTVKLVCIVKRKKMIATWHEVWGKKYWMEYLGPLGLVASWVESISARLPDMIVSISPHTTRALRTVLKVNQNIFTVPNGIDSEMILKIVPDDRTSDIIFAGRLLSHKNVDILLHAVSILAMKDANISAFIVGDGPEKKRLEKLAADLKIEKNTRFLGFVEDHDDLCALMKSSRVFVLPSTREGFGIVAIEANTCGLPVVTIDHEQNAAREFIVHGENGALVSLDKNALAGAIEKALGSPKDRDTYRTYAEKYNWQTIVEQIQKVYAV